MKMEPEQGITPNSWVVVEITHKGQKYKKIVSGWSDAEWPANLG